MTYKELEQLMPQLYQAFEMPMLLYHIDNPNDSLVFPQEDFYKKLLTPYQEYFKNMSDSVHYYIDDLFYTTACFWNQKDNYKLLIGPIPSTSVSKSTAHSLLYNNQLKFSEKAIQRIQSLPSYQYLHFINIISLISKIVLNFSVSPSNIKNVTMVRKEIPISQKETEKIYQSSEEQNFHNSLDFETQYLTYIKEGNLEKLKQFLNSPIKIDAGFVADNNLRQVKNLFIASITLATRASIRGGLEPERAYQISDLAIQEMEKMSNLDTILEWQRSIIFELTKQTKKFTSRSKFSPVVHKCLNYIATHINEPLTVEHLAKQLFQNRSYLSRVFKAEVGTNLSNYILERKLSEAKDLLRFSKQSISDISNYLAFSSQSYFQTAFKKKYNITPLQYRKQNQ